LTKFQASTKTELEPTSLAVMMEHLLSKWQWLQLLSKYRKANCSQKSV